MGIDYPLAGHWHSREEFLRSAYEKLHSILDEDGLVLDVVDVHGGGIDEWAVVELKGRGRCRNGEYHTMIDRLNICSGEGEGSEG